MREGATRGFDFHLHTRSSDGYFSTAELLRMASDVALAGISITDHDTVDAYRDPAASQAGGGPWLLQGVEVSTRFDGEEMHVLGYFPAGADGGVVKYLEGVIAGRNRRVARGIVNLRERGLDISYEECARLASGRIVSRSHMAQVLVAKRYVARPHSAYADLLGSAVVPLPEDGAEDVIAEIGRLGGLSVWAHPDPRRFDEQVHRLVDAGLDGVEAFVPRLRPADRARMAARARSLGLLVTGGSDWHGWPQARALGGFRVGESDVAEFLARIGRA
ncbi:MAG TPA: hypothetical protein VMT52_19905 [Planctomycetota bacterium]|nr:hypothetical protein [Planctomycetota bacterium]